MNKGTSLALLVIGIVLFAWGMHAAQSLNSEITRVWSGSPSNKAMWLEVAGLLAGIVGLFGLFKGSKGN